MPSTEDVIASLLLELAKYQASGNKDNERIVRNELSRLGWKPAAPAKRAERPTAKAETRTTSG